jgi:GTP pyrophosphokinase
VEVDWGAGSDGTYSVDIAIEAFDRQGLLRDITTLLSNADINVTAVNTQSFRDTHTASMVISAEVANIDALSKVLARIGQLPNVTNVRRKTE